MIVVAGLGTGISILTIVVGEYLRKTFNIHSDIPTDAELHDLQNKLNRMALDRANERNNP